jgi:hypothetical protein
MMHAAAEARPILELLASQPWSSPWLTVAVVTVLRGALVASLVATSDVALGAANYIIGWCLLVATRGCLPACLCGAVHDCLTVGGMLGGDVLRFPKRAPKEVALSASPRALLAASGQRNWAA